MARGEREFAGVIDIATPNITIPIMRHSVAPGVVQAIEANSGDLDPTFVANMLIASRITAVTRQMTTLASFGIAGAGVTGVDVYYQQKVENAGRNATSKIQTLAQGMGAPTSLTAQIGQDAELTLEFVAKSADGTTAPITPSTGAMPTNPAVEIHTIGPMKINGTEYDAETFSINFGLPIIADVSGGLLYPTSTYLVTRAPTISFTFKDVDARLDIGIEGLAQSVADSTFYLRKLARLGGRVSDVTAEHIKFTVDDGMFTITEIAAAHGDEKATYQATLVPVSDGTAAIVVIDTASAIT